MKSNAPKYRWFFYRISETSEPNDIGEYEHIYTLLTSGFFKKEVVRKPIQIEDASVSQSEIQYLLRGVWLKQYEEVLTNQCIAYCPAVKKVAELISSPVDNTGQSKEIFIYIVDNILREIDIDKLCLTV